MSTTLLAVLIGILAFVGLFAAVGSALGGLSAVEERIRQLRHEDRAATHRSDYLTTLRGLFRQLGEVVPRSPEEMSRVERKLVRAGFRRRESVFVFHGTQAFTAAVLLLLFAMSGRLQTNIVLYGLLSVLFGSAIPDLWLALKTRKRQENIQLGLPDCLDLQVVSVEAGLGLDQALQRISMELRHAHPELCDELYLYNLEVNAGKSRAESLRNLGARSEVADLKSLTAVLIQTDRFGTSVADSLRVFSDSLRTKRRQRAEEQAAKMSVKMLLPLMLCILPATFAVVVGPAAIRIVKGLIPFLTRSGH